MNDYTQGLITGVLMGAWLGAAIIMIVMEVMEYIN